MPYRAPPERVVRISHAAHGYRFLDFLKGGKKQRNGSSLWKSFSPIRGSKAYVWSCRDWRLKSVVRATQFHMPFGMHKSRRWVTWIPTTLFAMTHYALSNQL